MLLVLFIFSLLLTSHFQQIPTSPGISGVLSHIVRPGDSGISLYTLRHLTASCRERTVNPNFNIICICCPWFLFS